LVPTHVLGIVMAAFGCAEVLGGLFMGKISGRETEREREKKMIRKKEIQTE